MTPPPVDTTDALEWLLPPAEPDANARAAVTAAAIALLRNNAGNRTSHNAGVTRQSQRPESSDDFYGGAQGWSSAAPYPDHSPDSLGAHIYQYTEWAYWSDSELSPDITKFQSRYVQFPERHEFNGRGHQQRNLLGVLDHGIFWIGEKFYSQGSDEFGAGSYGYNNYGKFLRSAPHIFHVNATWRGDAFAMERAMRVPVTGPAELTLSSVDSSRTDGYQWTFTARLRLKNENTDIVQIEFRDTDTPYFESRTRYNPELGPEPGGQRTRAHIDGSFLGPQAEEVVGAFGTPKYYGSFGLRR